MVKQRTPTCGLQVTRPPHNLSFDETTQQLVYDKGNTENLS
jgi:hypothetical protein